MTQTFQTSQIWQIANGAKFIITKIEADSIESMHLDGTTIYRNSIEDFSDFFAEMSAELLELTEGELHELALQTMHDINPSVNLSLDEFIATIPMSHSKTILCQTILNAFYL